MKYEYIFWDFNGTILDDVSLCLDILNSMLSKRGKEKVSLDKYRHIFTFPIIEYYKKAGLTFEIESFSDMAVEFINIYQPNSLKCSLYEDIIDAFEYIKRLGIKQILLSASEKDNLLEQVNHFNINKYFYSILGLDNIHAKSKIAIGKDYVKKNNINKEKCLMIGDTLHDYELANELGFDSILLSYGHQAYDVLKNEDNIVLRNIKELINYLDNI